MHSNIERQGGLNETTREKAICWLTEYDMGLRPEMLVKRVAQLIDASTTTHVRNSQYTGDDQPDNNIQTNINLQSRRDKALAFNVLCIQARGYSTKMAEEKKAVWDAGYWAMEFAEIDHRRTNESIVKKLGSKWKRYLRWGRSLGRLCQ